MIKDAQSEKQSQRKGMKVADVMDVAEARKLAKEKAGRLFHLPLSRQLQFHRGLSFQLPPKPLSVEIGCGDGTHSLRYCQQNPHVNLIAIEKSPVRFRSFQKKIDQLSPKLSNLYPIQTNAISWIFHFIPAESIQTLFILYPNPYPKSSQRNKRWHAMPFMGELIRRLQFKGQIVLTTNEFFYLQEAQEYLQEVWNMQFLKKECFSSLKGRRVPRTAFEKKYLQQGCTCYSLIFEKTRQGHLAHSSTHSSTQCGHVAQ